MNLDKATELYVGSLSEVAESMRTGIARNPELFSRLPRKIRDELNELVKNAADPNFVIKHPWLTGLGLGGGGAVGGAVWGALTATGFVPAAPVAALLLIPVGTMGGLLGGGFLGLSAYFGTSNIITLPKNKEIAEEAKRYLYDIADKVAKTEELYANQAKLQQLMVEQENIKQKLSKSS
jgi:hypothetical protein